MFEHIANEISVGASVCFRFIIRLAGFPNAPPEHMKNRRYTNTGSITDVYKRQDCDHAPDSKRITEYFHRFCNPFTYANSMSKWTDDLMGIRLFQLIISHIITDKMLSLIHI